MIIIMVELVEFCEFVKIKFYVMFDIEFLCECIYYFKLCLIQVVFLFVLGVKVDGGVVVLIDLLVGDLLFELLYDLFCYIVMVKVFYVVWQDLEIFFYDVGVLFDLLFDIQIVVMVCGFGEQVGYEMLVKKIVWQFLDKFLCFIDWLYWLLLDVQVSYVLVDVMYLWVIYEFFVV